MNYRSTLIYLFAAMVLVAFYLYEHRKEEKEQAAREEAKILFSVKTGQLQSLTLKREKETIRLEKKGPKPDWSVVAPVRTSVDKLALSRLLRTLAELKCERLISESGTALSEFGLDKPPLVVSFRGEGEEETLLLGAQSPMGSGFYVSVGRPGKLCLISVPQKQELDKSLYDLREKRLFSLETDKLTSVIVERRQGKWHFFKKEGQWVLEGAESLKVDQKRVEVFLRPIVWADALSFEKEESGDLKAYGLQEPAARIVISTEASKEEIVFGDPVQNAREPSLYAKVNGKPQIVTVRKRLLDDIPIEEEKLREADAVQKGDSH